MAWIEFHPTRIKRLQKFQQFRNDLGLSENEALGALGSLWGEVMDLAEAGDITGWTPRYVAERAGLALDPDAVWSALVGNKWIDIKGDRVLVHDWLDCAGRYLIVKYASGVKKEKLVGIWSIHGLTYSAKHKPTKYQPDPNQIEETPQERKGKEGKGKVQESSLIGASKFLYQIQQAAKNDRIRWVAPDPTTKVEDPTRQNDTLAAFKGLVDTYGADKTTAALGAEIRAKGRKTVADAIRGAGDALAKAKETAPARAVQYGDDTEDYTGVLEIDG